MDRHNIETVGVRRTGWAASGPRSAGGPSRICLSPLRHARPERMPGASERNIISRMVFCRIYKAKSRSAARAASRCASFPS